MSTSRSFGSFQLHSTIGAGTRSVVYRAWDPRLSRWVALKVLRKEWARDPEIRRMFSEEARKAAALDHESIVRVYGVDEHAGQPYIAYQFVDGQSLADRVKKGALSQSSAIELLRPVAAALDYAHARSIMHGDIKPSNILINRDGKAMITDFGMATRDGRGAAGGTPEYMAPELFNNRPQSRASDVYALGVTAFEMLVGQPPFVGDTRRLAAAHAQQSLPEPSNVSKCVMKAIRQATAKQPGSRWESAGEFVEALDCRRMGLWTILSLTVLLMVMIVAGVSVGGETEGPNEDSSGGVDTGTEPADLVGKPGESGISPTTAVVFTDTPPPQSTTTPTSPPASLPSPFDDPSSVGESSETLPVQEAPAVSPTSTLPPAATISDDDDDDDDDDNPNTPVRPTSPIPEPPTLPWKPPTALPPPVISTLPPVDP